MDPVNGFRERLHRTASLTRDLIVHTDADRWEVFAKASTLCETSSSLREQPHTIKVEETGVAVRTFDHGRSGFAAASGLDVDASRRAVDGAASSATELDFDPLPPPHLLGQTTPGVPVPPPPREWMDELVPSIARGVQRRSADHLEVRHAVVQEGTYSWLLTNAEGFVAAYEGTTTSLLVETALRSREPGVWREWFPVAGPDQFDFEAAIGQICDRALLETGHVRAQSGLWDVILHSEIVAQLIAALVPLFLARPGIDDPLSSLVNRDGQLTGEDLTLIDDRIGPDVPIVSPCDGEGLPATRTLLLDHGVPRHRLASYRDAVLCSEAPRGGAVRLSYRDYPRSGISNLRVDTSLAVTPAALLEKAPKSLYLLRPLAGVLVDAAEDEYRILASGVWIDNGKIEGRQPVVELRGSIAQLLRRLDGIGNDLRWHQTDVGLIGATSLLARRQRVT